MNTRTHYYMFDKPVPYKKLLIYPVRIKDYIIFGLLGQCLMLEKNSIRDPVLAVKAISMSYFEFMITTSSPENNSVPFFIALMALVLNEKDNPDFEIKIFKNQSGKYVFRIKDETYDQSDFDTIREIIAEQNFLDLPDERIQKDVRDSLEEARKFKEKVNGSKTASFEDQLTALAIFTGWDIEKVYELTFRRFIMSIRRANQIIMSNIYLTASMSGLVTFKDKSILKGWLADIEETDKYKDVKVDSEVVGNKINFNEAMKK